MTTVLLIHGGLWEDMNADRFWREPGIIAGLESHDIHVLAPDRAQRAASWASEAQYLTAMLPDQPVTVIAGSNGCLVAVRLALTQPERIERLLLAWPATAGDPQIDTRIRVALAELVPQPRILDALLAGQTLHGTTDDELVSITKPVGVLPSTLGNPFHQRRTIDALLRILPQTVELPGCPEPPTRGSHPTPNRSSPPRSVSR